jgi:hypothetical protein
MTATALFGATTKVSSAPSETPAAEEPPIGDAGFVDQPLTKYDEDPTWDGQVGLGLHFDVKF